MTSEEVNVIAIVENLELAVPKKLPQKIPQLPRIIEISDRDKKLELIRQLNIDNDNCLLNEIDEDRESMEILNRLPPGSVLIKQLDSCDLIQNDNSGMIAATTKGDKINNDNDTDIDCNASDDKTRKFSERIRSKRAAIEARRNPKRDKKYDTENDRLNSRQRLLSTKRKNLSIHAGAAAKVSTKNNNNNYMNTRSTTRKMYNVGATYLAPTKKDENEWRDWPVHGMHERPVFYPQIGLAAEYNGRIFEIVDGECYRELSYEEQFEIVTVDPRVESLDRGEDNCTMSKKDCSENFSMQKSPIKNLSAAQVFQNKVMSNQRYDNKSMLASFLDPRQTQPLKRIQSFEYARQQLEKLRNYEKFQQIENLQRLQSQRRPQNADLCQKIVPGEAYKNFQNKAFAMNHSNSPKCLVLPKNTSNSITLPIRGLSNFQNNITQANGKIYFLRTPPDHPQTGVLSNSYKLNNQKFPNAWSDFELKNKLNQTLASNNKNKSFLRPILEEDKPGYLTRRDCERGFSTLGSYYCHLPAHQKNSLPSETITSRHSLIENPGRIAPIAIAAMNTTIENNFKTLPSETMASRHNLIENPGAVAPIALAAMCSTIEDNFQVLDLSKKVEAKSEISGTGESTVCPTNLVSYFQNFDANENLDFYEGSKKLS